MVKKTSMRKNWISKTNKKKSLNPWEKLHKKLRKLINKKLYNPEKTEENWQIVDVVIILVLDNMLRMS